MKKSILVLTAVVFLLLGSMASRAEACNCKEKKAAAPKTSDALAAKLLPSYQAIRASLAADRVTDLYKNANIFINTLNDTIKRARNEKKPKEYIATLSALAQASDHLTMKGMGISHYREHFGKLSDLIVPWVRTNVSAKDAEKYQLYYCDMAKHHWLQRADEKIGNPYYGTSMADCGEKRSVFAASACGKGTCGSNCDKKSCGQSNDMSGMHGM